MGQPQATYYFVQKSQVAERSGSGIIKERKKSSKILSFHLSHDLFHDQNRFSLLDGEKLLAKTPGIS